MLTIPLNCKSNHTPEPDAGLLRSVIGNLPLHSLGLRLALSATSNPLSKTTDVDANDSETVRVTDVQNLYERYAQRSLAFLISLGLGRDDAEDVHHQGWVKILQALQEKPVSGSFRAWMFQIMRNTAIDWMRKKKPQSLDIAALDASESETITADDRAIQQEYRETLDVCLSRLDEHARELVRGRLAGVDYGDIAQQLDIEVSRAHRLFFSAKESLTRCVEAQMGDER